ncbi:MAG: hypothetical protein PHE70_01830 [Tepidanaerobacteraceae bacterium]|nr:hypothetical protein [Tepidanaerobacteraceae bacterium]
MKEFPKRKNIRLKEYDYSQAGYNFVTICTHNRQNLLGKVVGGGLGAAPYVILSNIGKDVEANLLKLLENLMVLLLNHISLCPIIFILWYS